MSRFLATAASRSTTPGLLSDGLKPSQTPAVTWTDMDADENFSSAVFRLDHSETDMRADGNAGAGGGASSELTPFGLAENITTRAARLDFQHRLRLIPAALWGDRARGTVEAEKAATAQVKVATVTATPTAKFILGPKTCSNLLGGSGREVSGRSLGKQSLVEANNNKSSGALTGKTAGKGGGGGGRNCAKVLNSSLQNDEATFVSAQQMGAKIIPGASLKKQPVTASVPLRWQSKVVALSSIRDHRSDTSMRGSCSSSKWSVGTRSSLPQRNKKKR